MIHQDVMCWPIAPVGPEQVYDLAKNEICSSPYLLNWLLGRQPSVSAYAHCVGSVWQPSASLHSLLLLGH